MSSAREWFECKFPSLMEHPLTSVRILGTCHHSKSEGSDSSVSLLNFKFWARSCRLICLNSPLCLNTLWNPFIIGKYWPRSLAGNVKYHSYICIAPGTLPSAFCLLLHEECHQFLIDKINKIHVQDLKSHTYCCIFKALISNLWQDLGSCKSGA